MYQVTVKFNPSDSYQLKLRIIELGKVYNRTAEIYQGSLYDGEKVTIEFDNKTDAQEFADWINKNYNLTAILKERGW